MKVWIFAQIKTRSESFHTRFEKLPLTTQFFLSAIMKTVLGAKLGHPMAFIRPYVWSTDIPVEKKSHSIQLPKNMIFTSRAIKNVRHFKPWKILLLDQKKMSAKSPILDHYLSVEGYTVQEARNFLISCEILQFP